MSRESGGSVRDAEKTIRVLTDEIQRGGVMSFGDSIAAKCAQQLLWLIVGVLISAIVVGLLIGRALL